MAVAPPVSVMLFLLVLLSFVVLTGLISIPIFQC